MRIVLIVIMSCSLMHLTAPLVAGGSAPIEKKKAEPAVEAYNKGTRMLLGGNYKDAIIPLRAAIAAKPDFAQAHNNLAFCLRKQGQKHFAEALKHYNLAISHQAKLAEPYMYRGVLHVQMGNTALARADLATLVERGSKLAAELQWVIDNGREKNPDRFFGVTKKQ